MNIPAIVVTVFFIMLVIKFFGKNIINKIRYLFGTSFISMGLTRFSFLLSNIDNIVLVILFFVVCIVYIIIFDIEIKNKKTDKVMEKHSLQITGERVKENFDSNMKNDITPMPDNMGEDIIITDTFKKAFKNVLDIDLERQFDLPEYNDICRNKDPSKMRETCELLNDKKTCDSANCCMWCNTKNTCIAGKGGVPLYDIDNGCVKNAPSNDSDMVKMAKKTLKEIGIGKINKLEKDFEYKSIEEMTNNDYKIILQLSYQFIKQKKHREALTQRFNKLSKPTTREDIIKRTELLFNEFVIYYVKINPNSTVKLYKNQGETIITYLSKNRNEKIIELRGNKEILELMDNIGTVIAQDIKLSNAIRGVKPQSLDSNINVNPPSEDEMNVTNKINPTRNTMQIQQSMIN